MPSIFAITNEILVNTVEEYTQWSPSLAIDSSGNFVVVWDSQDEVIEEELYFGVYGQRFSFAGNKLGAQFQVNTYQDDDQQHSSVSILGTGEFIVVWDSFFQPGDNNSYGVYGQRFNNVGGTTGGETLINTTTAGSQRDPVVGVDSLGNYVVVWRGDGPGADTNDIYFQRFNSSGGVLTGETLVNAANNNFDSQPALAVNASGMFAIAWMQQISGNDEVFVRLYDSSGTAIGSVPTQVNTTTTSAQNLPKVAIDNSGNFVVVWESSAGGTIDLIGRKFNSAGVPITAEFLVSSSAVGNQSAASIAMHPTDGSFVVAWQDSALENNGTNGVYVRRFTSTATSVTADGAEIRVNQTTTGNQFEPSVSMRANGDFAVAWTSNQNSGGDFDIFVRSFVLNDAPTDLVLSATNVNENVSINTVIGAFTTLDSDLPYDTLTYSLVAGSGSTNNASFNIVGNQLRTSFSPNFEAQNSYSIRIRTTDQGGLFYEKEFIITINDINEAPTALNFANTIPTLAENSNTSSANRVADIAVTDDALGTNTLSLTGTDAAFFEIIGTALYLKADTVLDFETKSSYSVTVNVDDTSVGGSPDVSNTFTLTLTDINEAPTALNFANTIPTLAENSNTSSANRVADIAVTDDALGTNTLSLTGTDAAFFEIIGTALYLKADTVLDFETKTSYSVTVNVDDTSVGGSPDASNTFTLTLTDINEAPTALNFANTIPTLAENSNTSSANRVADIAVTDDALGTNTLSLTGTDAAFFEIIGTELYLKAGTVLDFETKSSYSVTVNVDDTSVGGSPDASNTFTLTLTDVNEAPTVGLTNTTTTLAENSDTGSAIKVADIAVTDDALGTNTLSLTGTDAAFFEIIGTALYLKAGTVLDFETKSSYSVTVNVDDTSVGGSPDASNTFTLTLTDVNEAPTVGLTNTTTTLAENSDTGSAIKVADIAVTDDALGTNTLSLTGTDTAFFEIIGSELYLKAGTILDFETKSIYSVTIAVDDPAVGTNPDNSVLFTLNLTDVNEAPSAIALSQASIDENVAAGSVVGFFNAADPDQGDTFIYSLVTGTGDSDNGAFAIANNALQIIASPDFEAQSSYSIRVRVTDAEGLFTEQELAIAVNNLNETPTAITLSSNTVAENAPGAAIGTVGVTDPDIGNNHTFSVSDDRFEIVASQLQLKSGQSLDFEAIPSLVLTVTATDNGKPSQSFSQSFTITTINVNEAPSAATVADQVATVNTAFTSTLATTTFTDPDAGETLTLTANLADGSSLPAWLSFNATTGTFSGIPATSNVGTLNLKVTATDAGGLSASTQFSLVVSAEEGLMGTATKPVVFKGSQAIYRATGTTGTDLLRGTYQQNLLRGLDGNDRLYGGRLRFGFGRDIIYGGKGNDYLNSGSGRDKLLGQAGDDTLIGGKGDDILIGGSGSDKLNGGEGKDMFVFKQVTEGVDRIVNFKPNDDLIDLRAIFAKPEFGGVSPFSRYKQFVQLVQTGTAVELKIDSDGNGSGAVWQTLAVLQNTSVNTLSSQNFVIV
ncbi:cadherin domain-containing protein [Oculatella sp. LEGE 06141]|uniref:cadherin domain-containing protein n=1 Tax=Oculatella sp. LEGE 06141 TaxID=1828648 RepID=UPI001881007A|nr:cadherin domain-containing protein [Oculatella sp. LEGE 06141]MBE9178008.1 cadherin domain-containing protein [Oculatella sp. LEGE 06141]